MYWPAGDLILLELHSLTLHSIVVANTNKKQPKPEETDTRANMTVAIFIAFSAVSPE